jgi:hypothetical protein
MVHPLRLRRLTRASLVGLAIVCSGCVSGNIYATVAPHLGQTTDCVPYKPMAQDAKDWLASNKVPAPQSYFDWEDYQADKVKPKLDRDCEGDTR